MGLFLWATQGGWAAHPLVGVHGQSHSSAPYFVTLYLVWCTCSAGSAGMGWDVWPLCCGADRVPDALRQCSLHIVVVLVNAEPSLNSPNTIARCRALEKWHHMQNSGQTGKLGFAFGRQRGQWDKAQKWAFKEFSKQDWLGWLVLPGRILLCVSTWNIKWSDLRMKLLLCIMVCFGPFNAVRSGRRENLHHKFFI